MKKRAKGLFRIESSVVRGIRLSLLLIFLFILSTPAGLMCAETEPQVTDEKLLEDGVKSLKEGKYLDAKMFLGEVTTRNPEDAKAWYYLGQVYMFLLDYEKAVEAFSRVAAIRPKTADLYFMRAKAYSQLRMTKEALADLDVEIETNPSNAEAYLLRSTLLTDSRKYDQALDDLEKARGLDPNLAAQYHFQRAHIFHRTGRRDKALSELDMAEKSCKDAAFMEYIQRGRERLVTNLPISVSDIAELRLPAAPPGRPKRFDMIIDFGGEWTDNVVTKADELSTPDYIDTIHDVRGMMAVYSDFKFVDTPSWSCIGSYTYNQNWHNEAKEYNLLGHNWKISVSHFNKGVEIGGSTEFSYSYLMSTNPAKKRKDYNAYRAFSTWADITETTWTDTKVTYTYIERDYFTRFKGTHLEEEMKNGHANYVSFAQRFSIKPIDTRCFMGFMVGEDHAWGADNRYNKYRAYTGFDCPLLLKHFRGSVYFSFDDNRYQKFSTFLFGEKRKRDNVYYLDTTLYIDVCRNFRIYGGYVHTRYDCNILAYDYTERRGKLGVVLFF